MPKNAVLVNTARKEVIDEEGLLKMFELRPDFKYISDIAPDCIADIESKYPNRYFFTPKKWALKLQKLTSMPVLLPPDKLLISSKRSYNFSSEQINQ